MSQPVVMTYASDFDAGFSAVIASVADCGLALVGADKDTGLVTFESGPSMRSPAGQRMSAHLERVEDGQVKIVITGVMKANGGSAQIYDWDEAMIIANRVFEKVGGRLGQGEGTAGAPDFAQLLAILIAGLVGVGLLVWLVM